MPRKDKPAALAYWRRYYREVAVPRQGGLAGDVERADRARHAAGPAERARLGKLLAHSAYPGWQLAVESGAAGEGFAAIAFRSDPDEPGRLQALGPWPLPEDAGPEEVRAVALAAVVAVDGEGARERFRTRDC